MKPLNPALYNMLRRRFGTVKVGNQNEKQVSRYCHDLHGNEMKDLVHPGEYYIVCCPFCSDTRFRLYINHMWGKRDERGYRNLWMAICFNETMCLGTADRRLELYEEVAEVGTSGGLDHARIHEGKEVNLDEVYAEWPGPVTRVDHLKQSHKAYQYLVSRDFDPRRIGPFYNVHYCHDSFRWLARQRLIIPVYSKKRMIGWQARAPRDDVRWDKDGAPPKYYTMPGTPRRMVVYNIANARRYHTGVGVEGPTDVWSFGPMSCCTLGAGMTHFQKQKITSVFKDRSFVLLWDPEEYEKEKTQKLIRELEDAFAEGFAAVKLPKGRDPGSLDRWFMRDYVEQEAKKQGVRVSWELV